MKYVPARHLHKGTYVHISQLTGRSTIQIVYGSSIFYSLYQTIPENMVWKWFFAAAEQTNKHRGMRISVCLSHAGPASQPANSFLRSLYFYSWNLHPSISSISSSRSKQQTIYLSPHHTHTHTHTLFRQTQLEAWKRKGEKSSSIIPSSAQTYIQTDRQTDTAIRTPIRRRKGRKSRKERRREKGRWRRRPTNYLRTTIRRIGRLDKAY